MFCRRHQERQARHDDVESDQCAEVEKESMAPRVEQKKKGAKRREEEEEEERKLEQLVRNYRDTLFK